MNTAALYVVATPIGNLEDMVPRAVHILQSVALIAAEDTRHSRKLMAHFGIETPMIACHDNNEQQAASKLLATLQAGSSVAIITDAGTPAISDPGYRLVRLAHEHGIKVVPIPGACAAIAALSASGLPSDRFLFCGFLPAKPKARRDCLQALLQETATLVFYESPHRIVDSIADIAAILGEGREAVIAREITKLYETITMMTLGEMRAAAVAGEIVARGEIVLVVTGATARRGEPDAVGADHLLATLLEELPVKQAAALAAKILGQGRRELYQRALQLRDGTGVGEAGGEDTDA